MEKTTTEIATTDADDRLSSLPDEVITHILSFLQTKYAVGTTILSRRWKDHWARVWSLDFDNSLIYEPPDEQEKYPLGRLPTLEVAERRLLAFCRFVCKVLNQHKNLDSVRRFRCHYSIDGQERDLGPPGFWFEREWVFGPLVEEIDIMLEGETEFGLPHCKRYLPQSFYTLKNLKVVKLEGVILSASKGSVLLPSVKILQLCYVQIDDLESLSSLISGCPVLETAFLECCVLSHMKKEDVLIIALPSLKNLKMIRLGNPNMCPIVIEAPNLEELYLVEFAELKFMGSSPLSSLHSAHVYLGWHQSSNPSLAGVLNHISNAKKMFLCGQTLSPLSGVDDVQFPDFPKLTHLTIGTGGNIGVLHSLLHSASKLHSLVIKMEGRMGPIEREMLDHLWTPECLLSSLEEIEVRDVVNENEMKMVAYLLEAGAVLKKVNMHVRDYHLDMKGRKNLASLLKLPRRSSLCEARLWLPNNKEIRIDSDNGTDIDDDMFDDDFIAILTGDIADKTNNKG